MSKSSTNYSRIAFSCLTGMKICSEGFLTGFRGNVLENQGVFIDDVAVEDFEAECEYGSEILGGISNSTQEKVTRIKFIYLCHYLVSKWRLYQWFLKKWIRPHSNGIFNLRRICKHNYNYVVTFKVATSIIVNSFHLFMINVFFQKPWWDKICQPFIKCPRKLILQIFHKYLNCPPVGAYASQLGTTVLCQCWLVDDSRVNGVM